MGTFIPGNQKFFGLVQLDASGKVIFCSPASENNFSSGIVEGVRGRDFFSEVAPFENAEEFRQCINSFRASSRQASSINFTCRYKDGSLNVRVLLARIRERPDEHLTKSILVHMREAQ
ncbi:MAG TPA: PAS domain-containing protein [Pyrinomonadaceae bacterium]|nr:PAS domain-containing protein [Pyrinomonadaceae bacterium]